MEKMLVLYSRMMINRIVIFMGLLFFLLNVVLYLDVSTLALKLSFLVNNLSFSKLEMFTQERQLGLHTFNGYMFVSIGSFLICGLFLWLSLRITLKAVLKKSDLSHDLPKTQEISQEDKVQRENIEKRHFLHLVSIFQKEGRLMDFFAENLDDYEDEQIGAAVRSIHENCKKVLSKYIASEPVVKEAEGDEIVVPQGFDPSAIKLTGRVTGEPPFKGLVRHRGWKISKLEMPILSATQDFTVIAPAEVEIV